MQMACCTVFDIATLSCYMGVLLFLHHIGMIANLCNYKEDTLQHDKSLHIYEIYKVRFCYTAVYMTSVQHYILLSSAPCYNSRRH